MSKNDPAFRDHQAWLGYLQPDGLVVSPAALVDSQFIIDRSQASALQQRLLDYVEESESETGETVAAINDLPAFLTEFLDWPTDCLWGDGMEQAISEDLRIPLRELGEELLPTFAFRNPKATDGESPWLLLIKALDQGSSLDHRQSENSRGWSASEHQRFERLLRETQVPIGLITNLQEIRLIYAPRGESTGHITFPVSAMGQVSGRLIVGAFHQLLKGYTLLTAPSDARLATLLRKSRDYQANVSTKLAEQVVEALYELLRGFQSANEQTKGVLLGEVLRKQPENIYRGLLNSLLRIVFLLYAEDRGLMPTSGLYVRNYSVHGLFERLRADHERYPDTMDHRYGAWSQLLAVFRLVFYGSKNPMLGMPPRNGYLFDPDPCPFLEGRNLPEPSVPLVPDGTIYRMLSNLLMLDGERLSYKTLDVEQIGSVYETIMGFKVEQATGRMIALKPKKRHGAPIHIDLDELASLKGAAREKLLNERADTKLPTAAATAFKAAESVDDMLVALEKRIDKRATPSLVPSGAIILQPTDERRRSGSHYTPRSFTEPIVRKTLEPVLDRLGRHPRPEAILDLKIADIAVGSAAFLVETCRQLADELVSSWHYHQCLPAIPHDEDEVLFARRKVAQRCLYGVDRNPMAVDLAKLSLWLATMAKDHPFTFLDHAIKCGDSLVGLTNKQIAAFHWDTFKPRQQIIGQDKLAREIQGVSKHRREIIDWPDDNAYAIARKHEFLLSAESAAKRLKTIGDICIAAFFAGTKSKERETFRDDFLEKHLALERGENIVELIPWQMQAVNDLRSGEHPIRPFHWELEFPEVFSRENPGFDAIVGNPPFIGGRKLRASIGSAAVDWLLENHKGSSGNADLVAHFFLNAAKLIRLEASFGLLATNTISQGDTRRTGLKKILDDGCTIYDAVKRQAWPGDASVIISIIHTCKGRYKGSIRIDGAVVEKVTAYLLPKGTSDDPHPLGVNKSSSYQGNVVLGKGFTFSDSEEADEFSVGTPIPLKTYGDLLKINPKIKEAVFPFIGAKECNDNPDHKYERLVIDFRDHTEEFSRERWPELMKLIERKVKPQRQEKSPMAALS